MKKSTSAKSELIFPFHYRPFSIFKNILYDTNHFSRWFIRDLMVYRIFGIQLRKTDRIGGIKAVYPLFQNFFRRHNHA